MKRLLLVLIISFIVTAGHGQRQGNIWYFGDHAGLDFNSGSPVVLTNGQTHYVNCPGCHAEGTAVIADSSGNLLFYCNGSTIWNRSHQVMLHGDSLLSNNSSTQSSLILPRPGSSQYFYVFTTDDYHINNLQYGFRYSVVDMCADGGLGGVIPGEKNILLLGPVTEKLTAVKHANGVDYWVIVHRFYTDEFYCYLLTATGITTAPVVSSAGSIHTNTPTGGTGTSQGQLKASPNGQKLALVNGNTNTAIAEYFDFDKSTGIVSNAVSIQTNQVWSYYGVSFSPDNSKLYIACTMNGNGLYQFDLNAGGGNPAAVVSSKVLVAGSGYNYLGLQLATDGKIYIARSPFSGNTYLDVINNPNNAGTACNYVNSAINLGTDVSYGFPNFLDSYEYNNTLSECLTGIPEEIQSNQVFSFPNPFSEELTFTSNDLRKTTILLYDLPGKQILQQTFTNSTTINTTQLTEGIYFYELINDEGTIAKGKVVRL